MLFNDLPSQSQGLFSDVPLQNQGATAPSIVQNMGQPIKTDSTAANLGIGLARSAAGTIGGMSQIGQSVSNWASKLPLVGKIFPQSQATNPITQGLENFANAPSKGVAQSIGRLGGDIAQITTPSGIVSEGQKGLEGLAKGSELVQSLPTIGKYAVGALAHALPEATFGGTYGAVESGGDPNAIKNNALGFGIFSGLFKGSGDAYTALKGGLGDNLGRALGFTGKGDIVQRMAKAADGLKVIADNATGVIVKDINGAEHAFNPAKATFFDTMQAWKTSAKSIYDQYSALAEKAGDTGAKFTQGSFSKLFDSLDKIKENETTPFANKASQIKNDILRIFGDNIKSGVSLPKIQSFLEQINKDVNPLSDSAAADVSQRVSGILREMMDDKITFATGEGYQALRNQYSALKSIEGDIINQTKKYVRGAGGKLSSFIEGVSTIESMVSLMSSGPLEAAKRGIPAAVMKVIDSLRDPEANLQRAFDTIINPNKESGAIKNRVIGSPTI